MRWLLGLGLCAVVGCAAPKTSLGGLPQPAEVSPAAASRSCPQGTNVVYRRPLDAKAEVEVVFTCAGDHVTATSVALPYPAPPSESLEGGEESDEGYDAAFGNLDVAQFNTLRRAITSRIRDGACRPTGRTTSIMIGVGTAKWRIACEYSRDWHELATALETALEASFDVLDPRVRPDAPDELLWPFESDYWKDELGYYRRESSRWASTAFLSPRP